MLTALQSWSCGFSTWNMYWKPTRLSFPTQRQAATRTRRAWWCSTVTGSHRLTMMMSDPTKMKPHTARLPLRTALRRTQALCLTASRSPSPSGYLRGSQHLTVRSLWNLHPVTPSQMRASVRRQTAILVAARRATVACNLQSVMASRKSVPPNSQAVHVWRRATTRKANHDNQHKCDCKFCCTPTLQPRL